MNGREGEFGGGGGRKGGKARRVSANFMTITFVFNFFFSLFILCDFFFWLHFDLYFTFYRWYDDIT